MLSDAQIDAAVSDLISEIDYDIWKDYYVHPECLTEEENADRLRDLRKVVRAALRRGKPRST
jgi:hypothetical protein